MGGGVEGRCEVWYHDNPSQSYSFKWYVRFCVAHWCSMPLPVECGIANKGCACRVFSLVTCHSHRNGSDCFGLNDVAFIRDSSFITAGSDGEVFVWNHTRKQRTFRPNLDLEPVISARVHYSNNFLAIAHGQDFHQVSSDAAAAAGKACLYASRVGVWRL